MPTPQEARDIEAQRAKIAEQQAKAETQRANAAEQRTLETARKMLSKGYNRNCRIDGPFL